MKIINKLLDYPLSPAENTLYLATTNTTVITKKGESHLVMGAGTARIMRDLYPTVDQVFAAIITESIEDGELIHMDCVSTPTMKGGIGYFTTKYEVKQPSTLAIVQKSTNELLAFAQACPEVTIHLPMPGVGLGGLSYDDVLPIVSVLPDNVIIYYVKN